MVSIYRKGHAFFLNFLLHELININKKTRFQPRKVVTFYSSLNTFLSLEAVKKYLSSAVHAHDQITLECPLDFLSVFERSLYKTKVRQTINRHIYVRIGRLVHIEV